MAKKYDLTRRAMIGKNLANARRLAGYSQSDVMREIWHETSNQRNRISEIETGRLLPDAELLSVLCQFYGVSADYVCGLSAEPEIDQTAGRVGMIYNGLQEIASESVRQMVESLSKMSASYIAAMPKPHALAMMEAAKLVWHEYTKKDNSKIKRDHPELSDAIFKMFNVVKEFERAQAINLNRYNIALEDVLQHDIIDPTHHLLVDALPLQKRYRCVTLPRKSGASQGKSKYQPSNQIPLNWPTVSDMSHEDGDSED